MSWRQEARGHALNSSLNHSLPLTSSLTLFVAPLLPHSLIRVASLSDSTLTLSLTSHFPTHSLSHPHTHSVTTSTHSILTRSLTQFLTHHNVRHLHPVTTVGLQLMPCQVCSIDRWYRVLDAHLCEDLFEGFRSHVPEG